MQDLPGPHLQGLSGYLSCRDLLRARLVCKNWRVHLVARVPVCIVLPLDASAVESGIPLLPYAQSAVLALDEVHLDKLQQLSSRPDGNLSSATASPGMQICFSRDTDLYGQLELLGRTCKSLRGLRLLFQPAVVQLYNPEAEHWLSAACSLWLSKVFHGWTSFAPRLHQLHIAVGSMQPPCVTTLAHALQLLPCLEDFLLSCKHITADHALAITQMTGLRALSLHDKHKSSNEAWWAAPRVRASPPSLQRLTSLVLDSPGLTATEGLPPFISSTGLQRLELLGSPGRDTTFEGAAGSVQDLQNVTMVQTPFAALLLCLPHLHTLAINTPTLSHSDWTALSTLCAAKQITELRINHWRNPEAGPRGLTAFKTPEVQDVERMEDGKEHVACKSIPLSPLGLANCLVAKATLLHPAQLPLLLVGCSGQPSSSCRLRELHLAFLEASCTAPEGETNSMAPDSSGDGNLEIEEVVRSAWSAILGCVQLQELNVSRTNMLPLTDAVLSQLPEKLPMLEVLQYNGYLDIRGPGYHHIAQLPFLSTLALGSIQAPSNPNQPEFHLQLWQLPQQLQCLSLLNAVIHSHPGGMADRLIGFPPGLRQLSLKFCRLASSLNTLDGSQGAQKESDTYRTLKLISQLSSLMSLHVSGTNEMAEPGAWQQLAGNLHNLEILSLTLPGLEVLPSSSTFVDLVHEIAGVTSLQHFKLSVHSQGLCFTGKDLTPILAKLKRLKTMELGILQDLRSSAGQTSPNRLLDPRADVAPLIVQQLPQCRFKLLVDDFEPTVQGLDQTMANLEEDSTNHLNINASDHLPDGGDLQDLLNDPDLNAELQALELEEGG